MDKKIEGQEAEGDAPDLLNEIKQVKSESSRKFDNINSTLSNIQAQMDQALAEITARSQSRQAPSAEEESLEDLAITNPREYARQVSLMARQEAQGVIASNQQTQATLNALVNDYPELGKAGTELYNEALKEHNNLPKKLQGTPEGYRIAARDAAANLGVLPVSKRQRQADDGDDDFVLNGQGARGSDGKFRGKGKKPDVSEKTIMMAKMLGRDPDKDPKILERLKSISEKKQFKKFQEEV
jgi:hypothetical protein